MCDHGVPRKWNTRLRKDGQGFTHFWACGEKRYLEDGQCAAIFKDPPKESK